MTAFRSKKYLFLLSLFWTVGVWAHMPEKNSVFYVSTVFKNHPIITGTFSTVALIVAWYAWVQIQSKNRIVSVELKEFNPVIISNSINYFYAHGIAESYKQAYWYSRTTPHGTVHSPYLYDGRLFSFDFPDATQKFWRMNFTQTSLAQANEIEVLRNAYEQAVSRVRNEQAASQDFILMGMSRGATSILNFLSIYKPEHVKAIVVESPFESTHAMVKNMLSKLYLDEIPGMQFIGHALVGLAFWQHDINGISAIDLVEGISKDLPVLFIASHQDLLVPASSTIALYNKIKQSGHKKVHLYTADLGAHGRFLKHENGYKYQNVVQAFYRQYCLPYDSVLADLGQADFERC